jgi:hypothetical protein
MTQAPPDPEDPLSHRAGDRTTGRSTLGVLFFLYPGAERTRAGCLEAADGGTRITLH